MSYQLILKRGMAIVIAIVVGLLLLNCKNAPTNNANNGNQKTPTPTPAKSAEPPAGPTISGDINDEKALTLLYGKYNAKDKNVEWSPDDAKLKALEVEDIPKPFYASMIFAKPYQENKVDKYLVLTKSSPKDYDCHGCAPLIGGAIFVKDGGNWRLSVEQKYITFAGSYGEAADAVLTKLGPEKYGVVLNTGSTGQGFTGNVMMVLAEVNKDIKPLSEYIDTYGDNAGNCGDDLGPCWKYEAKPEFVPGKDPNFYDLKLTTTGTRDNFDDKGVVKADEVKLYQYNNGKYTAAK